MQHARTSLRQLRLLMLHGNGIDIDASAMFVSYNNYSSEVRRYGGMHSGMRRDTWEMAKSMVRQNPRHLADDGLETSFRLMRHRPRSDNTQKNAVKSCRAPVGMRDPQCSGLEGSPHS
ncbi:hypothetical protein [Methylobacterium oryzisoli]|uniref:hypothetical protein n=1 Tax=Methylobacterium oryzisoli TaxID=3385502 RepID=UPI003892A778